MEVPFSLDLGTAQVVKLSLEIPTSSFFPKNIFKVVQVSPVGKIESQVVIGSEILRQDKQLISGKLEVCSPLKADTSTQGICDALLGGCADEEIPTYII